MAGDNQHHVWQMLQRGFGERKGKGYYPFIYSKDEVQQERTENIGASDKFYNRETDSSADDVITNFENSIQRDIQAVRRLDDGAVVDSQLASQFVAHLEMRSMFLREEMSRLGERAIEQLRAIFSSKKAVSQFLESYLQNNPDEIKRILLEKGIGSDNLDVFYELVETNSQAMVAERSASLSKHLTHSLEPLLSQMAQIVKSAHLEGILGGFSEIERAENLATLNYHVVRTHEDIILPDTCLATLNPKGVKPLSSKDDGLEEIIAPLTSNLYLYGYKKTPITRDTETIRTILSSCAFEFFLARSDDPSLRKLCGRIGKNAKLVSDAELKRAISLRELLSVRASAN